MEKNKYFRLIGIFFSILVLFFILTFSFNINHNFSENENRYLQSFPSFSWDSFTSGKYIKQLENFITDHFSFRDFFMGIKSEVEILLGKTKINSVFLGSDEYLLEDYNLPTNTERFINVLNSFYLRNKHINNNLMLVPTSISINSSKLPLFASYYSQFETIDEIYQNISFASIDVRDTLLEHNNIYPMYYRLDHHWTTYAAYYAYVSYCEANSLSYLSINDYLITEVTDDFNGTLYSKTNIYNYQPDSIYLFTPKTQTDIKVEYVKGEEVITSDSMYVYSYLETKDKYSFFLDNNVPLIKITNNKNNNNKKLLVIKDSYANSLIPFLTYNYQEIHVIDPRYYKNSITEYIKTYEITDSLFLYNMNTLDTDTGIYSIN